MGLWSILNETLDEHLVSWNLLDRHCRIGLAGSERKEELYTSKSRCWHSGLLIHSFK